MQRSVKWGTKVELLKNSERSGSAVVVRTPINPRTRKAPRIPLVICPLSQLPSSISHLHAHRSISTFARARRRVPSGLSCVQGCLVPLGSHFSFFSTILLAIIVIQFHNVKREAPDTDNARTKSLRVPQAGGAGTSLLHFQRASKPH